MFVSSWCAECRSVVNNCGAAYRTADNIKGGLNMALKIIKLIQPDNEIFKRVCEWYYEWLGKSHGESYDEVIYTMEHSINTVRLPQTFVALVDGSPAGMYQLAIADDLTGRPDVYPWLINVYVCEGFRGRGVCRALMESVAENAAAAGMDELYLYTKHVGLYEKFGWEYVENVLTFDDASPVERLYRLNLRGRSAIPPCVNGAEERRI